MPSPHYKALKVAAVCILYIGLTAAIITGYGQKVCTTMLISTLENEGDYNNCTILLDQLEESTATTVSLNLRNGRIHGAGLLAAGKRVHSVRAASRLQLNIENFSFDNVPLRLSGYFPLNSAVFVNRGKAVMSGTTPVIDISDLRLVDNFTLTVAGVVATWSGGDGGSVVRMSGSSGVPLIADGSALFVNNVRVTGGSSLLHMSGFGTLFIRENSALAVDGSSCNSCTKAAVLMEKALSLSNASMFRVSQVSARSTPSLLFLDSAVVDSSSLFALESNEVRNGVLLNLGTSPILEVNGGSTLTFHNLSGNSLFSTSGARVPSATAGSSTTYAGLLTVGGQTLTTLSQLRSGGIQADVALNSRGADSSTNYCAPKSCVPGLTTPRGSGNLAGMCTCQCVPDVSQPSCTARSDPTVTILNSNPTCNVARCKRCILGFHSRCSECDGGNYLTDQFQCQQGSTQCTDTNCALCTGAVCLSCKVGFIMNPSSKKCVTPSTVCSVSNCGKCQPGNAQVCVSCLSPYRVSDGACVIPPPFCTLENCERCVIGAFDICDICSPHYVRTKWGSCTYLRGDAASGLPHQLWAVWCALFTMVLLLAQ